MAIGIDKAAGIGLTHQINEKQKTLSKTHEKLATGKRINHAQDDAAGLAVAKLLEAMSRGYKADSVNIGDAMSAMNIAEGATQGISDMLGRMQELSIQASNDTLNDSDRKNLDTEFQELKKEITRLTSGTQFNTQDLLTGSSPLSDGTGRFQVGPNHTNGLGGISANEIGAPESRLTAEQLGLGDLNILSRDGATKSMDSINQANKTVIGNREIFGSTYNRLEYAYNNNANMDINTSAALSLIEDLDLAKGAMDKARDEILGQSAILAQRNFQEVSRNSMLALLGS
ncbi:flagellin [Fibrobacterales bacterium]|nr:flagellin [Fibrobacterales bacterium]